MLSWLRCWILCRNLYLCFMESADHCRFLVELDLINLLQGLLFWLSAYCISWILLCHHSSEPSNAVHCRLEPMVPLILWLCITSILNRFLRIAILHARRNAFVLPLISTWYPPKEIPEPYSIVACMSRYLEYLILLTSWTHPVLLDNHIPIL